MKELWMLKKKVVIQYGILAIIIGLGFYFYTMELTYSCLWYDEAVEYWYSKVLIGEVPGGIGTSNMYERICSTYQPPLYNVLMHIWLIIFDYSDYSFRLAGVLTTLIGSIGFYLTIKEFSNWKCASVAACIYIFTPSIAFYAMECAEYNLMVCFISWDLYFAIRFLKQEDIYSIIGFFCLSSLAVYSQYGAAFLVIGLWVILLYDILKKRNYVLAKGFFIGTFFVTVIAAIPLVFFFLIPQLSNQGTLSINHGLIFQGNIIYDIFNAMCCQLNWSFGMSLNNSSGRWIMLFMGIGVIFIIIALCRCDRLLKNISLSMLFSWIIYYLSVSTSYYAYNSWSGNIRFGNKYGLFLVPQVLLFFVLGSYNGIRIVISKWKSKIKIYILYILIFAFVFQYTHIEVKKIKTNWVKEDIRAGVSKWFDVGGHEYTTYVHSWSDFAFRFYIMHDSKYSNKYDENIQTLGSWIREANINEIEKNFDRLELFEKEEFCYVGPTNNSLKKIQEVMIQEAFEIVPIYEGDATTILFIKKSNST